MSSRPRTLLHLTDTHLASDPAWRHHGVRPQARLAQVLEQARRGPRPDLVLVTGDIGHDEGAAVYQRFRREIRALGAPVQVLPGNHDVPSAFAEAYPAADAAVGFAGERWVGPWRVLSLDSQVPGEVAGRLGADQLRWLAEALAAAPAAPTLVALHHAPVATGTPWLDDHRLADSAGLLACLEANPQVRGVLFGHVHQGVDTATEAGLRLLATPAVTVQFQPGSQRFTVAPDEPPALRWVELAPDGAVETALQRPAAGDEGAEAGPGG